MRLKCVLWIGHFDNNKTHQINKQTNIYLDLRDKSLAMYDAIISEFIDYDLFVYCY